MLDSSSLVPLYRQLADELSELIRSGRFGAGERIPSEHALAAEYKLGRPTVRQATELLVRRRLLERRRGSGTYVSSRPRVVDLLSLGGTLESFRHSGLELETRLTKRLELRRVAADEENPFSRRRAYRLERVGSVAGRGVLLERMFLSPKAFPALGESVRELGSLSRHIERRYGASPTGGRQSFRVHPAPEPVARALGLAGRAELLLVKRTLDFPRHPGAVFAELYCHTEDFVFTQSIGDLTHA